jgi:MoxR-like ATPase
VGSHPRARQSDAPNAEVLGTELRRIATRLDDPGLAASEKSQLRDELSLLASRCEWVTHAHQREFLQQEIQALWPRLSAH